MAKNKEEAVSDVEEFHLADLLYPSAEKRQERQKRGADLSKLPQDYVRDLELETLSRLICPENSLNAMRVFTQLSTDEETLNYRLDILEDFLKRPFTRGNPL